MNVTFTSPRAPLAAPLPSGPFGAPSRRGVPPRRPVAPPPCARPAPVTEADLYSAVDPSTPTALAPQTGPPLIVAIPAGLAALLAVTRTLGALARRRDRSLEDRGFKRSGSASEDAYARAMKGMKTIEVEELPDELVQAARRRRRQEIQREGGPVDLDSIELPENHPFAVKKQVSAEEEEMQRLRLSARRGLSPEDMRLLKQQQALAEAMEAEEEARRQQQQQ